VEKRHRAADGVELYTPLYQLLLSDNDFWRGSNSLQLDETIGIYVSRLLGMPWTPALINNKHRATYSSGTSSPRARAPLQGPLW